MPFNERAPSPLIDLLHDDLRSNLERFAAPPCLPPLLGLPDPYRTFGYRSPRIQSFSPATNSRAPGLSDPELVSDLGKVYPRISSFLKLHPHRRGADARRRASADITNLLDFSDSSTRGPELMGTMGLQIRAADHSKPLLELDDSVRDHFQRVTAHWPYWLFYLAPSVDNMMKLLFLTCSGDGVPSSIRRARSMTIPIDQVRQRLRELFDASLRLQQYHAIPAINVKNHGMSTIRAIQQCVA